jgi:dTDP-4-amino-4,6-dideoxygalactose transaminase
MKTIPFFSLERQNELIGQEIKKKISDVIDSQIFVGGPVVEEFEDRWAAFNGHKHCVFCSSGTSALEIAIRCLDLDNDCYIYTSANSFLASSSCISANNKQPFFLDTDSSCNFDIAELEKYLKQNLDGSYKDGIIGVHLYGNSLDLIRLKQVCHAQKVPFILDLAQAHGCEYQGKPVASYAYLACFSHYVTKTFGA